MRYLELEERFKNGLSVTSRRVYLFGGALPLVAINIVCADQREDLGEAGMHVTK
jgi:hypothetical protein